MKKYFNVIESYQAEPSSENLQAAQAYMSTAYSKIDKAVKCKVLHKNNGARKKARLARTLKQVSMAAS